MQTESIIHNLKPIKCLRSLFSKQKRELNSLDKTRFLKPSIELINCKTRYFIITPNILKFFIWMPSWIIVRPLTSAKPIYFTRDNLFQAGDAQMIPQTFDLIKHNGTIWSIPNGGTMTYIYQQQTFHAFEYMAQSSQIHCYVPDTQDHQIWGVFNQGFSMTLFKVESQFQLREILAIFSNC